MTPKSMGGNSIGMSSSQTSGPDISSTVSSLGSQSSVPMHHLDTSRSTVGTSSSTMDVDSYPMKEEADEGSSSTQPPPSPSPDPGPRPSSSSLHSPTTSDVSSDALDFARCGVKRSPPASPATTSRPLLASTGQARRGPALAVARVADPALPKPKQTPTKTRPTS
ncbi:putative uncharacterized protein DDB_G0290521 [Aplysia californica]|uniref:Uncharacterized protein n=1 Tax=Aplysia californica TaxID=6500 RepID=A0ABM1VXM5_APLCA|nr:putative uncharacterized protein DDB_G0290521 [Aplysia californica]